MILGTYCGIITAEFAVGGLLREGTGQNEKAGIRESARCRGDLAVSVVWRGVRLSEAIGLMLIVR